MHIHILGICGTFMGGVAALATEAGHRVTGSDANAWPPMSTQLEALGIRIGKGYDPAHLEPRPDVVVVGNVMSRGNPSVEAMLNRGLDYCSGPEWLARHVLRDQWVIAVAGTHGKTTTASLLAHILHYAGLEPGFLIGGVPDNFGVSARAGGGSFFVVEADEYDTAFFDKRSKFVHYRPRTLVLNNLEFDHADIFDDLAAIQRQFHHLVRTVPGEGLIVHNAASAPLDEMLAMGCWSRLTSFAADDAVAADVTATQTGSPGEFDVTVDGRAAGSCRFALPGRHNAANALAAIAAARHAGVPVNVSLAACREFAGVRRRMQVRYAQDDITVYDDFAHHPTAIAASVTALRESIGDARLVAVLEPRSNTMKLGVHRDSLAGALDGADEAFVFRPAGLDWDLGAAFSAGPVPVTIVDDLDDLIGRVARAAAPGSHVLIMSNGGFGGLPERLPARLTAKYGRRHAG